MKGRCCKSSLSSGTASATGCTSCDRDGDCIACSSSYYLSSYKCYYKKSNGDSCSSSSECRSGICVSSLAQRKPHQASIYACTSCHREKRIFPSALHYLCESCTRAILLNNSISLLTSALLCYFDAPVIFCCCSAASTAARPQDHLAVSHQDHLAISLQTLHGALSVGSSAVSLAHAVFLPPWSSSFIMREKIAAGRSKIDKVQRSRWPLLFPLLAVIMKPLIRQLHRSSFQQLQPRSKLLMVCRRQSSKSRRPSLWKRMPCKKTLGAAARSTSSSSGDLTERREVAKTGFTTVVRGVFERFGLALHHQQVPL